MKRGRAVKVVEQRHPHGCGVAALSMLLDVPYGDASAAVRSVIGTSLYGGTGAKDLQQAARALGVRLKAVRRRKDYLDGQTGILGVLPEVPASPVPRTGHWIIFKAGVVVDTDGTVWPNAQDYFKANKARPVTLLVRVE